MEPGSAGTLHMGPGSAAQAHCMEQYSNNAMLSLSDHGLYSIASIYHSCNFYDDNMHTTALQLPLVYKNKMMTGLWPWNAVDISKKI